MQYGVHILCMGSANCIYCLCLQLVTPKFPVVMKVGHAHCGMGKVSHDFFLFRFILTAPSVLLEFWHDVVTTAFIRLCSNNLAKNGDTMMALV